jgi:proton-translocating NADH-quinone oxidoreductase, chain L
MPTQTCPLLATLAAVILPLAAFVLSAALGRKAKSGVVSIAAIALSLLAAGYVFSQVWNQSVLRAQWEWFTVGAHAFHVGILVDNTSALMLLLVNIIALPVHIYSIAYMKGDPGIHRYWTYLSLFCFAMLGLTVADNLLLMYICWELVGFASYLLIGFWFTRESAVQANKKAFIMNRIGDIGLLIGIAIIYSSFGTLDIHTLFGPQALVAGGYLSGGWLTTAGLAFFLGAMAKSAQFPLHGWLPDAMEGPTAVSSLIHAATMVAAGVFLLARVFPLFNQTTLLVMTVTGSVTALAAAFFALTQYDIKRILAFSTISQLGFMMVGIGTGMHHVALFHLTTHAFFKCLLFLCAGVVIHEMQHLREKQALDIDPQDIRNMGGLRAAMPVTFGTMLIASLALTGFPLTGGYLSKDALLVHAFEWAALQPTAVKIIPYLLTAVSVLTSFYIFRLLAKVFFGTPATQKLSGGIATVHDAPMLMRVPMLFLAACSLFPLFTFHPLNDGHVWLLQGLMPDTMLPPLGALHLAIPLLTLGGTLAMAFLAWKWYVQARYPLAPRGVLYRLSLRQGYLDAVYDRVAVRPVLILAQFLRWIDGRLVDGLVNSVAGVGRSLASAALWTDFRMIDGLVRFIGKFASGLGNVLRRTQAGRVQQYLALAFFIVLVVLLYHIFAQA